MQRRELFSSLASSIRGVPSKQKQERLLRPPYNNDESLFLNECSKCDGICATVCEEEIIKIALYHHEDSEKHIFPLFEDLTTEYKIIISGKHWVDISDIYANKGNAIELLQKNYNISMEETIVFGDYNNDIEMLKRASFSFAMENAHQNAKDTANYKTKSNDEFGVEVILKELIRAKESFFNK